MAPPFHQAVAVDWSAACTPRTGRDSIWAAVRRGREPTTTVNLATRMAAARWLDELLDDAVRRRCPTLLGVDFSLGYPAAFAGRLAERRGIEPAAGPAWRATWSLLEERVCDDERNANNRFAVADELNAESATAFFWGRPTPGGAPLVHLAPTKALPAGLAPNPCAELRATERRCGRAIKSGWQLYGGVTVGGQVLTGVPYVARLARRLGKELVVWPFETGFGTDPWSARPGAAGPTVVVAEVWPSAFPVDLAASPVRDEAQVLAAVAALADAAEETWRRWLEPPSLLDLDPHARQSVVGEEGWILGIA